MADDNSLNYVPIEEARAMPGLRVAFTRGVPGAWSVGIKAILDIKGLDYVTLAQEPGGANEELEAWTGTTSAPVLMFNDDRPRANWSEMLVLVEQLRPEPPLIPLDEDDRIVMMGLCHEICGEDGLGWNIRSLLMSDETTPVDSERTARMWAKYRSPVGNDYAQQRVRAIIGALGRRLNAQAARGSRYFMGDSLTAADIYWTAFSNLFAPMSDDLCTMPEYYRDIGPKAQLHLEAPLPQVLVEHRDFVARTHFRLPINI